jgi:exopolyphosphatase / guanosine-5'-triphosphate,3'-diphosphate pyrophosphatase
VPASHGFPPRLAREYADRRRVAVSVITPRWEFRTFGQHFGAAEAAFGAMTPGAVQETDEVYLLVDDGQPTTNVVKIRFDLMDVKTLREVSPDGLERWEPVAKVAFPLAPADLAIMTQALRLPSTPSDDAAASLDGFLAEFGRPQGPVRAVAVHKRRVRYSPGGCTAEVSDVTADGQATRTIAIEAEDPEVVLAAVRAVGLGGYVNTSYPVGLAALLGGRAPRYAVIDVGTNSVKFHLAERLDDGTWRPVIDRAEITRMGEALGSRGTVAPGALERTIEVIKGMADEATRQGAVAIAAVGTAWVRAASDREDVLTTIRERSGVSVEELSGEEEARLAYKAVALGLPTDAGDVVVFDTGGGSTQFTFGHDGQVSERYSLPLGAVAYTERFGLAGAITAATLGEVLATLGVDFASLDGRPTPDALVAMGGAVTNLAAVKHEMAVYDPSVIRGTVLERETVDREIELFRTRDAEARRTIVGLQPARAEVILAGACIVRMVMDKLGRVSLTVSDSGLRHGVLVERFGA